MSASCLLDTNVLVYEVDTAEQTKCAIAQRVMERAAEGRTAISPQVLGEYHSVATRRFGKTIGPDLVAYHIERYAEVFEVCTIDIAVTLEALRGVLAHRMPFWDAQMWAVARLNHIPVVLSEDFSDGTEIEGVRFVDPFAEGFDLDSVWSD